MAIKPIKTKSASGGTKMANFSANRSHAMCMKIATMKPALSSMKVMISDHRNGPRSMKSVKYENVLKTKSSIHIHR